MKFFRNKNVFRAIAVVAVVVVAGSIVLSTVESNKVTPAVTVQADARTTASHQNLGRMLATATATVVDAKSLASFPSANSTRLISAINSCTDLNLNSAATSLQLDSCGLSVAEANAVLVNSVSLFRTTPAK